MPAAQLTTWIYIRNVVAPIGLAFLLTASAIAGFVMLSVTQTDQDSRARETTLLQRAMADERKQARFGQTEMAAWDEALLAYNQGDTDWFVDNFGHESLQYYDQSRVYILAPDQTPFFAMRDGGAIPASAFANVAPTIAPLIARLQHEEKQAALSAYKSDNRDAPPVVTDVGVIDGQPAIISVAPLVSDSLEHNAAPGMEPIYIAVTVLDATIANDLADRYMIRGVRFDDDPQLIEREAAIAFNDLSGTPRVWLKWLPDLPGERVLTETLPPLFAALLVLLGIIALLSRNLRKASNQLHAERADAQHRALHDPLTGLGNRALFRDRLDRAFHATPHMALLALDLDRFKQVNDNFGHEAGDELLRQVAARITTVLRPGDTLVRLGGDEFAIIQTGITSSADASTLASRVLSAIRAPFHLGSEVAEIGVSIGIATAPEHARSENELVRRADAALYRAKASGRHRYCYYQQGDVTAQDPEALQARAAKAMGARGAA